MSDRVAVIGGKTIGWDHFPFPVYPDLAADVTKEGFGVDLSTASKWFWRVKAWHLRAYLLMDDASELSVEGDFDLETAIYTSEGLNPSRESDLVINQFFFDIITDGDNRLYVYFYPTFLTKQAGDNFFFPIILHAFNEANETAIQNTDRNLDEGGPLPAASLPDITDCDSITNYAWYYQGGRSADVAVLSMIPSEFWPYKTKSGDSVYDTATGSQLRDPLS